MKQLIAKILIAGALALPLIALADGDAVEPQKLDGLSLYRDVTSIDYSTNVYYTQGATFLFTNMVLYSTADLGTNSVLQGLSNVTVEVAMSTSSSSTGTWETASVQVPTNGTWYCIYSDVPEVSNPYWQCRITDASTNVYYYQKQMLHASEHL